MKKYLLPATITFLTVLISCTKTGADENNNNSNNPPFEIWMGLKAGSAGNWANVDWKVVLPDGSYFNQLPREGFLDFSKNQPGGTWGTFTLSGNTGAFTNQYETIRVKKIGNTELEKVGYTNRLYKLAPVDGLKLSGKYNTISNWSTIPNYPYGPNDAQPMISFAANGTFNDQGAFITNFTMPYQDPKRAPGNGTYEIKNFTLILNYSDGRKIAKAFSGVFNNAVTATAGMVFIAGNPFYNQ
ncbi:hypothetical protein [Niabella drilacis]|uniref:Lipocalin-like domain-containing protein n=1 Tax=Niabella drilacis (strain DSM 25811 / CCM 8410 / CCUG 62505 / LMG 26954 / E90) TaxID=1285928 RepID=A0A1G6MTA4_NIADE|nr:hypothetical protein [Niabella drilacis]SDC58661.1 hypothetical protein SAMN04487894_10327 [Niabella drilacis]